MIARRLIIAMLLAALGLPISIAVIVGMANLLGAMGDAAGAAALGRVALACGILWIVDLVLLIVALGVNAAADGYQTPERPPDQGKDEG